MLRGRALPAENANLEEQVRAESDFYRCIVEASGNRFVAEFLAFLNSHVLPRLSSVVMKNVQAVERGEDILKEHEAVFSAILCEDPEAARRAARAHFTNAAQRLAIRTSYLGHTPDASPSSPVLSRGRVTKRDRFRRVDA